MFAPVGSEPNPCHHNCPLHPLQLRLPEALLLTAPSPAHYAPAHYALVHYAPAHFSLCLLLIAVSPTPVTTTASSTSSSSGYQKPYSYLPNGNYLTTVNDQIVDQNGNSVKLHGIAWFGKALSQTYCQCTPVDTLTESSDVDFLCSAE